MTSLQVGDKAPAINSIDENGNPITLTQFKGKKIILYFYPKDDTPGCTKEACSFRDSYAVLQKKGFVVLGVSVDTEKKHQKFIEKYDLNFPLIADVDKKVVTDYGVWGLKKFMGREYMGTNRVTFIIDEKGKIEHIITKVDTENSAQQLLELYK
ncbi:MAG: thioredoxin-dependent thiol peroxidase [Bacteroidota bacterium]